MFHFIGELISRRPLWCISAWIAVAALTTTLAPDRSRLDLTEPASLLPATAPLNLSMNAFDTAFPGQVQRSQIVIVLHRDSGLTPDDIAYRARLVQRLTEAGREAETWHVLSSVGDVTLAPRLDSADGAASLVVVGLRVNFVTKRAALAVDRVEALARVDLPAGLQLELTGNAAIGREHNVRSQRALDRTTWVTVMAVLVILALVYRSPLGALVPLVSIGLSVFIAFKVLDLLALYGWAISNAERTFTVVLLFGAGTDYALFWISRYREELAWQRPRAQAARDAMVHVGPAILASAGTTILGLAMLVFAEMVIIRNSGKVLGIVLAISLLAAITLTPALAYLMGEAFFWPGHPNGRATVGQRAIWPRLAALVVRRPFAVFLVGAVLIAVPAASTLTMPVRYDSFGEVAADSTAARGLDLARRHFSENGLFSTRFMLIDSDLGSDAAQVRAQSNAVAADLIAVAGVDDVWHVDAPYGRNVAAPLAALLDTPMARSRAEGHYYNSAQHALQFEMMQSFPFLSQEAVGVYHRARSAIGVWADGHLGSDWTLHAVGPTPYIDDVMVIADRDLRHIIVGVVVVIWLIVLAFVRSFWLATFMLLATLITYSAALGLTDWLFIHILGYEGIDYKIKILVFVIIVAVGQDYNIFLVTRIRQEHREFDLGQAIIRSIVVTGPVISSCGLIMAATLGSIATTGVQLTEQLGFAFAAGILIDTFLVRPVLIPSFFWLTQRRSAGNPPLAGPQTDPHPVGSGSTHA